MSQILTDRQTVVLLGASNLTLGWTPAVNALQAVVPGPLDVRVCLGLGRSYIDWSSFWFRRLPGILDSGLWESLVESGSERPLVLLTDLGNDIAYMRSPEAIFEAAVACVERLRKWRPKAQIVMTGLPLSSMNSLGPVRFYVVRSLFFPGCRLSFDEICLRSVRLDSMCRQFADDHEIPFIVPQGEWYGLDPIHVIPPLREKVFQQFFSYWNASSAASVSTEAGPKVSLPKTALSTILGIQRRIQQPAFESPEMVISAF